MHEHVILYIYHVMLVLRAIQCLPHRRCFQALYCLLVVVSCCFPLLRHGGAQAQSQRRSKSSDASMSVSPCLWFFTSLPTLLPLKVTQIHSGWRKCCFNCKYFSFRIIANEVYRWPKWTPLFQDVQSFFDLFICFRVNEKFCCNSVPCIHLNCAKNNARSYMVVLHLTRSLCFHI